FSLGVEVPEAFYLRAQALFHLGQFDDCVDDLTQMIGHKPRDWNAYWIRGLANENMALYLNATNDFTKVIELAPTFEEVYLHRADCYEKLGSFDWARRDRERYNTVVSQKK
ncbi:MAG TPA: tetratricopeptide repeat protein, partial [Chroococcales cyanobacterium]